MKNNTGMFGYFKEKKKMLCICKEIEDNYYRASGVQSMAVVQNDSNDYINSSISMEDALYNMRTEEETSTLPSSKSEKEENNNNNKENNNICEECKLKLINNESYQYNNSLNIILC